VILLVKVSVESRARRKSRRRVPEALCVTEVICLVKRSLESSMIEVTDLGVPRDDGVLEAEWCWVDGAVS
jgi:hypothetical protein